MINSPNNEKEIEILSLYNKNSNVKQRDLAKIAGLSLGMTNSIIKRLVHKGWLLVKKINNRNIQYAVTPSGIKTLSEKSYNYFKRTIKNIVSYKEIIEELLEKIKEKGYSSIGLIGNSDLDFIIEHICIKKDFIYEKVNNDKPKQGFFYLYSEEILSINDQDQNEFFLRDIIH